MTDQIIRDVAGNDITEWLKEYAARPQTEEELFEMRAAFGEGETVVNIFTGRVTVL
jgi:hypothetical protein